MRRRRSLLMIAGACVLGTLAGELTQAAVHNHAKDVGSSHVGIQNVRRYAPVRSESLQDFVATRDLLDRVVDIEEGHCLQREQRGCLQLTPRRQNLLVQIDLPQSDRVVGERPGIAVLVYNYAAVSVHTMSRAREKVNRLYREVGVEIEWLDPFAASRYRVNPTSSPSHTFTVQIVIRPMRASRGPSTPESVMGTALPADEDGGTLFLFYDQVVRVAHRYNQPVADILGLAIAHEMGHLLLPVHAHSTTGIMRARWDGDDIRRAMGGSLGFTSAQAALIRAKVDGCCVHGARSLVVNGVCHCQPDGQILPLFLRVQDGPLMREEYDVPLSRSGSQSPAVG